MRHLVILTGATLALLAAACSSSTQPRVDDLRAALDQSKISLGEAVGVAEASHQDALGIKAALLVESDPVFSVGTLESRALHDVRIATNGTIMSTTEVQAADDPCPGSISLAEAIRIAEAHVKGSAVQVQPDDDDHCLREVLVLAGDTLWEVKLSVKVRFSRSKRLTPTGTETFRRKLVCSIAGSRSCGNPRVRCGVEKVYAGPGRRAGRTAAPDSPSLRSANPLRSSAARNCAYTR